MQIDHNYVNLGMKSKGSIAMTLDPITHPQPMRIGSVTITGCVNPVMSFAATGQEVALARVVISGSTYSYYFRALSSANFTLSYWVFDVASVAAGINGAAGLRVLKPDGTLAYDSGMKPLRVVGVCNPPTPTVSGMLEMPEGDSSDYQESITIPSGKIYAAVQSCFFYGTTFRRVGTGSNSMMISMQYQSVVKRSATSITGGMSRFESFSAQTSPTAPSGATSNGQLGHFIIDVTNY